MRTTLCSATSSSSRRASLSSGGMALGKQNGADAAHLDIVRRVFHAQEEGISKAGGAGKSDHRQEKEEESFKSEGINAYENHILYGFYKHCSCQNWRVTSVLWAGQAFHLLSSILHRPPSFITRGSNIQPPRVHFWSGQRQATCGRSAESILKQFSPDGACDRRWCLQLSFDETIWTEVRRV